MRDRSGAVMRLQEYRLGSSGHLATAQPFTLSPGEHLAIRTPRFVAPAGTTLEMRVNDRIANDRIITYDEAKNGYTGTITWKLGGCDPESYSMRIVVNPRPAPRAAPANTAPTYAPPAAPRPAAPGAAVTTRFSLFDDGPDHLRFENGGDVNIENSFNTTINSTINYDSDALTPEARQSPPLPPQPAAPKPVPKPVPKPEPVSRRTPRAEPLEPVTRFSLFAGQVSVNAGDDYTRYGFKASELGASFEHATENRDVLLYGLGWRGENPNLENSPITETISGSTVGGRIHQAFGRRAVKPLVGLGVEHQTAEIAVENRFGYRAEQFEDTTTRMYGDVGLQFGKRNGTYTVLAGRYVNELRNQNVGLTPQGVEAVNEDMVGGYGEFRLGFDKDASGKPGFDVYGRANYFPEVRTVFSNDRGETIAEAAGSTYNIRIGANKYFSNGWYLGGEAMHDREFTPFLDENLRTPPLNDNFTSDNDYHRVGSGFRLYVGKRFKRF